MHSLGAASGFLWRWEVSAPPARRALPEPGGRRAARASRGPGGGEGDPRAGREDPPDLPRAPVCAAPHRAGPSGLLGGHRGPGRRRNGPLARHRPLSPRRGAARPGRPRRPSGVRGGGAGAVLERRRLDVWIPPTAPRKLEGALSVPGWKVGLLALQTEKEPFSRKKVRQAVAAGIDPALIAAAVERVAVPLQSFLPPGVWGRREGSPIMTADPSGVQRLLAEARVPADLSATLLVSDAPGAVDQARLAGALRLSPSPAGVRLPGG